VSLQKNIIRAAGRGKAEKEQPVYHNKFGILKLLDDNPSLTQH